MPRARLGSISTVRTTTQSLTQTSTGVPDLKAVVAHYDEAAERIKTEPLMCYVAESDGTVVGMVDVRISDPPYRNSMLRAARIASVDIVVDVDHRRRGIGRALMQRAEALGS